MAVAHVFAEADIGHDDQIRQFLFQQSHRLLHDAVAGVGAGGLFILGVGNAEEQDGGHSQGVRPPGFLGRLVGRELKDAGHGGDGLARLASAAGEKGQDQLGGVERGFAHEAAQGGRLAQAPGAVVSENGRAMWNSWREP